MCLKRHYIHFIISVQVSKPLLRRMEDGRVLAWSTEEDDYLCTLQEVFEHVSPHLGFNIELKFDDNIIYPGVNLNRALQAVLQVWIALVHLIWYRLIPIQSFGHCEAMTITLLNGLVGCFSVCWQQTTLFLNIPT